MKMIIVKGLKISAKKEKINIDIKNPKWEVNSKPLKILPITFLSLLLCIRALIPTNTGEMINPRKKAKDMAYKL